MSSTIERRKAMPVQARKMSRDGNVDFGYWFDKSTTDRLAAAARMIAVAFHEPSFLSKKVDRSKYSARKHKI